MGAHPLKTPRLRPAAIEDAARLLAWRNDPATRRASHETSEVTHDAHRAWLAASLAREDRRLWIAEEEGTPVGTVRADRDAPAAGGAWQLSWTVAPEARGRGVAKGMVAAAAAELDPAVPLRAEVKRGNAASVAIARGVGMALVAECDDVLHFRREPTR